MTHLVNIDKDYASWIEELSQRYKHSQIKAATHVNSEMLQFYWSLGKDIVMLHAESRWGDKILKLLSSDLQIKMENYLESRVCQKQVLGMPKDFIYFIMNGLQFTHNLWVNYKIMLFGAFLRDTIDIS